MNSEECIVKVRRGSAQNDSFAALPANTAYLLHLSKTNYTVGLLNVYNIDEQYTRKHYSIEFNLRSSVFLLKSNHLELTYLPFIPTITE
jgi:hypothetical protein